MHSTRLFSFARSRASRAVLVSACVVGAATAVVVAEQATVQRPRAEVLDAKGSAGEVIETVPINASLEVLGHEGPWVRVRTPGGKVGYVANAVLVKSGGAPDLSGITGGSNATGTQAGAAGRGWDKEVESYASSKNLNRTGLERMEAMRHTCRGKALRDFKNNGKLGGAN